MSWPQVKISEVTDIVSGATPKTAVSSYWGGDIAWATPADLSDLVGTYIKDTPRKITEAGLRSCAASVLPANSVLFSSRAPIGHVAINTVPMATNQGFKSFVPDNKVLDSKFLFWWLKAHRARLEAMGTGATFKEVSKATVSRVEIPLPPLDEQKRIAAILDKADQLRQKRRQAIALLDTLTQSIFLEMFGDPVSNPKGWRQATLGDVIFKASDGPHVSPQYCEDGIPFLSTRHIQRGRVLWQDLKYISEEDARVHWRKCKPERGDLLYTKGGTTGIAAHVNFDEEFAIWVHVALLKTRHEVVSPKWLECMLNSNYCYQQSQVYTHGIANRDLGLKRMVKIKLFVPPLKEQVAFVDRCGAVERVIGRSRLQFDEADSLFASLQHRAFTGQL
ncbi:restriction endonuclease subunit S [Mesorhizobium sp. KR2-14]|uniref:restriction endonuclease subunit S n=1 Tax=Mesorhizobium sp. KR2-14 TaxID=3156610 RepID=UPI0032B4A49F